MFCSFLIAIFIVAGVVTYYYHVNEPTDQDDDQEDEPSKISLLVLPEGPTPFGRGSVRSGVTEH